MRTIRESGVGSSEVVLVKYKRASADLTNHFGSDVPDRVGGPSRGEGGSGGSSPPTPLYVIYDEPNNSVGVKRNSFRGECLIANRLCFRSLRTLGEDVGACYFMWICWVPGGPGRRHASPMRGCGRELGRVWKVKIPGGHDKGVAEMCYGRSIEEKVVFSGVSGCDLASCQVTG
nr:uncharacterized protein LOC113801783 [Penaeus vannamei]